MNIHFINSWNLISVYQQADSHHPLLMKAVLGSLGFQCSPEQVVDFELCLADTQPAVSTGTKTVIKGGLST